MKRSILTLLVAAIPFLAHTESAVVTVSPLYANAAFRVGGVNITIKTYDMQRFKEGNEWNWTVNFCEVYADNELVAKIQSEEMSAGQQFAKTVSGKQVQVFVRDMPKVTRTMECRGPVQPCWTKPGPVSRARHITMEIIATQP